VTTSKRLSVYVGIMFLEMALIAACCLGCAGPRGLGRPPRTEAEVPLAFPTDRVVRVADRDGNVSLVVYLRPRPAAPRGGLLVYRVRPDGTVACVDRVTSN